MFTSYKGLNVLRNVSLLSKDLWVNIRNIPLGRYTTCPIIFPLCCKCGWCTSCCKCGWCTSKNQKINLVYKSPLLRMYCICWLTLILLAAVVLGFAICVDQDQLAHLCSRIMIHAVYYLTIVFLSAPQETSQWYCSNVKMDKSNLSF